MSNGELDPQIILVNGELASPENLDDLDQKAFSVLEDVPRSFVQISTKAFGDSEITLEHSFHEEDNQDTFAIDLGHEYYSEALCTITIDDDDFRCRIDSDIGMHQAQVICSELLQSFVLDLTQEKIVLLASDYIAKISGVLRENAVPLQAERDFSELKDLISVSVKDDKEGLYYVERETTLSLDDIEPDFLGVSSYDYFPPVQQGEDSVAYDKLQITAATGERLYHYRVSQWGKVTLEHGFHPKIGHKSSCEYSSPEFNDDLETMRVMAGFYEPGEEHANSLRYIIEAALLRETL